MTERRTGRRQMAVVWLIALGMTVAASHYQERTGPYKPLPVAGSLEGTSIEASLPRSHGGAGDAEIRLPVYGQDVAGVLLWRRVPSGDEWQESPLQREDNELVGRLPHQPPAGHVAYTMSLRKGGESITLPPKEPAVLRFRGGVSPAVLVPHIVFMMLAMLASNAAGLFALLGAPLQRRTGWAALALLIFGGFVFGPLVQQAAFGDYWTGVPFGWDLTDNKTLIAGIAWGAAVAANLRRQRRGWTLAAALVTILIFAIPHSVMGSTLDYSVGQVATG